MTNQYHRHDLIWLDPGIDAGIFAPAHQAKLARDWVKNGFPFVVARQSVELAKASNQIMLGFTLPSAPQRTRAMLCADRAAIIRHSRPLLLPDAMQHAPQSWHAGLHQLQMIFKKTKTVARVYGSLSSEAFTGKPYLDDASDLDLLLECSDETKLHELLTGLEKFPLDIPRIDGEILTASGWAVAWRELAAALRMGTPRQVLAKSDSEIRLIPVEEFTQPFLISA
jgi:phosphoribosyl-dephospho-CoA transferase